jgi:hypothetical protein
VAKRSTVNLRETRPEGVVAKATKATKIDVKQAVAKAMEYFKELVPNASNVALEEVERSGSAWLITLGYTDNFISGFVALRGDGRSYKVITIDAETGKAVSMKIRKP